MIHHLRIPQRSLQPCLRSTAIVSFALMLFSNGVVAEDAASAAKEPQPESVQLAGVFEAVSQAEIATENEHLTSLAIERVVPHGSHVRKGQSLVWLKTEALDKQLRDAETDFRLAKSALDAEEFKHQQFLETFKLDRESAKRERQAAQQEFDNYQKIDRDQRIKQAEFSLESSQFSLESATEEYEQLKKMYDEDDLTEESEEIVLRRAKRSMKSAEFALERAKIAHDRTINQSVPREDAKHEDDLQRAQLAFDSKMNDLEHERRKRELELEKKRAALNDQAEKLEQMREERKHLVLKAPIEGIFLHGELNRGKQPEKPSTLKPHDSVGGRKVVGVVVDPTRLAVRLEVPEDKWSVVQGSKKCVIKAKAFADSELAGTVKSVESVPFANGKFDAVISVTGTLPDGLIPTMNCDVVFQINDKTTDQGADE